MPLIVCQKVKMMMQNLENTVKREEKLHKGLFFGYKKWI